MKSTVVALAAFAMASCQAFAGTGILKDGDRVAILGDSITEIRGYSKALECYVELCSGRKDVKMFCFGAGGCRAPYGALKVDNEILPWRPTLVTVSFGMNDAEYSEYSEENAKKYRDGLTSIIEKLKAKGIACIIGEPTCCDPQSFTIKPGGAERADLCNRTLAKLAVDAEDVAKKEGAVFAPIGLFDAMTQAKAKYGKEYRVCGDDGVHPGANGSLVIACGFLKAFGCDGEIAKLSMDLKSGEASASDGHKILSKQPGKLELESVRYPYCFPTVEYQSALSMAPFVDFQKRFNRFVLTVSGLEQGKTYKVSWGSFSKELPAEELEKGVNLAEEFNENPFSAQFKKYANSVWSKEGYETWMVNLVISQRMKLGHFKAEKAKDKYDALADALFEKQVEREEETKSLHVPVRHVIEINKIDK